MTVPAYTYVLITVFVVGFKAPGKQPCFTPNISFVGTPTLLSHPMMESSLPHHCSTPHRAAAARDVKCSGAGTVASSRASSAGRAAPETSAPTMIGSGGPSPIALDALVSGDEGGSVGGEGGLPHPVCGCCAFPAWGRGDASSGLGRFSENLCAYLGQDIDVFLTKHLVASSGLESSLGKSPCTLLLGHRLKT